MYIVSFQEDRVGIGLVKYQIPQLIHAMLSMQNVRLYHLVNNLPQHQAIISVLIPLFSQVFPDLTLAFCLRILVLELQSSSHVNLHLKHQHYSVWVSIIKF